MSEVLGQDDDGDVACMRIDRLCLGFSPRREQQDIEHATVLAGVIDELPPIVVHAGSGRVIDGVHRVLAARLAERSAVPIVLFDGDDDEAYLESVRRNTTHGKPLSLSERRHAASRVLELRPDWSDRRIGAACGVSAGTVAQLRSVAPAGEREATTSGRLGRDGRVRPSDPVALRERIACAVRAAPLRPIRRIAEELNTSPSTVSDVKERLQRGESPIPPGLRRADRAGEPAADGPEVRAAADGCTWDDGSAWRSSPELARFVAWMQDKAVTADAWPSFVDLVPLGRSYAVVDAARAVAAQWSAFADALDERIRRSRRRTREAADVAG